jgi:hypothetical protein
MEGGFWGVDLLIALARVICWIYILFLLDLLGFLGSAGGFEVLLHMLARV